MDCSIPRHSTLQHSCFVSCQSVVTRIQIAYSGKFAGAKAKTNTPIFFGGRWYWRYSCSITRLDTYFSSDELRNILPPVSGETVQTPCARSLPASYNYFHHHSDSVTLLRLCSDRNISCKRLCLMKEQSPNSISMQQYWQLTAHSSFTWRRLHQWARCESAEAALRPSKMVQDGKANLTTYW